MLPLCIFAVGNPISRLQDFISVTDLVAVNYLLRQESRSWLATVLLVLYFVFFTLMLAAYGRTFLNAHYSPGIVPLSDEREAYLKHQTKQRTRGDIEAQPWVPPDQNPDSPGLEAFYSKDVFVCEADGRPKWCSECRQWKPDRARHSSELERCIRKMDHLCPWVGGMVSETCECLEEMLLELHKVTDIVKLSTSFFSSPFTLHSTSQYAWPPVPTAFNCGIGCTSPWMSYRSFLRQSRHSFFSLPSR